MFENVIAMQKVMYLQSANYKNILDSSNLESYDETYAHRDEINLNANETEIFILLSQIYCMHCFEYDK